MPELEEFGESPSGQVSRVQNLVYTLPHTAESIAEFLTPVLARIDPSAGGTQVVVATRDAEIALTISETILRLSGPGGIEVVPITSAARAGRIFKSRPVLAVAGPATELDPPSALIVARDEAAAKEATQTLRTLGYHDDDKSINVTRGELGSAAAHTVIFYQPPVTPAELQRIAIAKPVQVVAMAAPGEVAWLRELASGRLAPLNLPGPERRAHNREEAVRDELRSVLARGVAAREIIALEPLLREFDGTELAAAALHLLERERAQRRMADTNQVAAARPRPSDVDRAVRGSTAGMTRLFMTVGTRDGVKVGDIMGMIAGEGGIAGDRVGKIDLRESHALVEVAEADAASVIARVNGQMVRGRRVVVRGERDKEDRERSAGPRGDRPDRGSRDRGGPPRGRSGAPRRGPGDRPSRGGPRRD